MTEATNLVTPDTLIEIRKKEQKLSQLDNNKKPAPRSKAHHVGIEVEFFAPRDKFNNFKDLLIEHDVDKHCCVKSDGSIQSNRDGYSNCEITILFPETQMQVILSKICTVLELIEAKVNKSCGLHVHLDVRHREAKKVFHNLSMGQDLLYEMCPTSRKRNNYCRKIPFVDLEKAADECDRYHGINPQSVQKYKTVECRIHSGTVEFQKIFNWVSLLLKIATHDPIETFPSNINRVKELLDIDESLFNYIKERITKFYPESPFLIP